MTRFAAAGLLVTPEVAEPDWRLTLSLVGYGCPGRIGAVHATDAGRADRRIEYRRGPELTEWYFDDSAGLEQGFTIHKAPACPARHYAAVLEMEIGGSVVPELTGNRVVLRDSDGAIVLRYQNLHVTDALGRTLASRLGLAGNRITITTDLAGAVFPVTVDPLIVSEPLSLAPGDPDPSACFGRGVAIEGDTMVVGAPLADGSAGMYQGAAYVFVRQDGTWTQQAKLRASDAAPGDGYGFTVSISGDTLMVGGAKTSAGGYRGAAYVYARVAGAWIEQQRLDATDLGIGFLSLSGLSVSGDGAVIGGTGGHDSQYIDRGVADVFRRSGGSWTHEATFEPPVAGESWFGAAVAMSGDTVIVGAYGEGDAGAAYAFRRTPGGWSQQARWAGATPGYRFGASVAASGSTAIVGAPGSSSAGPPGGAYVFVENGGTWTQQATLQDPSTSPSTHFGEGVTIEGDSALVSGVPSTVYAFTRAGGGWSYQGDLVVSQGSGYYAIPVALSGMTAVVGHTCLSTVTEVSVFELHLEQGDACDSGTLCPSGLCVDGVCCDRACAGQCEACDVAGSVGTCTLVPSGAPHGGRPPCAGSGTCGGSCDGTSATACRIPAAGTECVHAQCVDGVATSVAYCDGAGACGASTTTDCGDYACGATECLTTCTSTPECASGHVCVSGQCVPQVDAGVQADAGAQRDGAADAGPHPDGADGSAHARGCACRQAEARESPCVVLLGVIAVLWGAARRRRGR